MINMDLDQRIIDRVKDLRLRTKHRIDQIQRECAPFLANKYVFFEEVFRYMYEGIETPIHGYEFRAFKTNGLRFTYNTIQKKKYCRRDYLETLVNEGVIYPFLLFDHGKVIKWSDIEILKDYNYTYIFIHNHGIEDTDFTLVEFPCEVRYGEDDDIDPYDSCASLYFNSDGLLTSGDDIACRLEVIDESVYSVTKITNDTTNWFDITELEDGQLVGKECIIPFDAEGRINRYELDNLTHYGFNLYKTTSNNNMRYYIFYYKDGNPSSSNGFSRFIDQNSARRLITQSNDNELVELLRKFFSNDFDFEYDREKSYEKNILDALQYIMFYNPNLMDPVYSENKGIIIEHYTGQEIHDKINSGKYDMNGRLLKIPRKRGNTLDNVAMVFLNGELYKYNKDIYYNTNTIEIPIYDVFIEDYMEIIIFTNSFNDVADIIIEENGINVINSAINMKYARLYTEEPHDMSYGYCIDMDDDGRTQLEVEYTYEKLDNDEYRIRIDDSYYYGRKLTIASDRQFRHVRYNNMKFEEGDYYFLLPTSFNYCHDKSRYLVFINNRMLSKQNFSVTITSKYRPFDKMYLYITTCVKETDIVDVYYVPESLPDVAYLDKMTLSGDIVIDSSELSRPISCDNYFIFVNGVKVTPDKMINISRNKIRIISDVGSIYSVLLTKYNEDIDILTKIFDEVKEDEMSKFIESIPEDILHNIEGSDFATMDKKNDYMKDHNPLSSIVSDIIVDFYMRRAKLNLANKVFVYDFETEAAGTEGKYSGILNLNTVDATRIDKIHQYLTNQSEYYIGDDLYKSPVD